MTSSSPISAGPRVEAERAAFEKWGGSLESWLPNMTRMKSGYKSAVVDAAWHAWKARAATPVELPVLDPRPLTDEERENILDVMVNTHAFRGEDLEELVRCVIDETLAALSSRPAQEEKK